MAEPRAMGQERWFLFGVGMLALASCFAFRLLHPADVAASEAGYLIRCGAAGRVAAHVDALAERISSRARSSLGLGWQLAGAGFRPAAARLFQAAWKMNPRDVDVAESLIGLALGDGRKSEAAAVFAEIHARGLALSDGGLQMEAGLRIDDGDLAGAARILNQLASRRPQDSSVRVELGDVLSGLQSFARAAAAYRIAASLRPEDQTIHLKFARALTWDAMRDAREIAKRGNLAIDD